jgi:hypothetical protein
MVSGSEDGCAIRIWDLMETEGVIGFHTDGLVKSCSTVGSRIVVRDSLGMVVVLILEEM